MTAAKTEHYIRNIFLRTTKSRLFDSLTTEVDQWWSTMDQTATEEGDIFTISFGGESYWKFMVLEADNDGKIIWQCIESNQDHNLKGIDEEWIDSKLIWQFNYKDNGIQLKFLHQGLLKSGVCYDVCSTAWDFYLMESLKSYLENGKGKPNEM